jgi:hypothetical protein
VHWDVGASQSPDRSGADRGVPYPAKVAVHEADAPGGSPHRAVPALCAVGITQEDLVARLDARHGRTDAEDRSRAFVAIHTRERGREDAGLDDQVCVAQSACRDFDEDLCRGQIRGIGSAFLRWPRPRPS